MHVIIATNINDAWPKGLELLASEGVKKDSRNGTVTVVPLPVVTMYSNPVERVVFDPVRDANPMFHLHEALWMLAGRDDADWLDRFVADFSGRFAEEGGRMHGAYGKRWRDWFTYRDQHGEWNGTQDQLDICVELLQRNHLDRQAVIQMWDPILDLGVPNLKDRPCNQQVLLRADRGALDITVTCRSNDAVYGCYGANVVHFSVLQEYLAARIGIPVGYYCQMSNNFHMYDWAEKNVNYASAQAWQDHGRSDKYPGVQPLVDDASTFDSEVKLYLADPFSLGVLGARNTFLPGTALPMYQANEARKAKEWNKALEYADSVTAPDWRQATLAWIMRRAP